MAVFAQNKKARFDYEILETFQAGIVLIGQEVKAIKTGHISIKGSYVIVKDNEFFLIGANIPPYQPKNAPKDYDPERLRKLLLTKSEIKHLIGKIKQKGLTLVPIKVYTVKGKVKIIFGIGRGKKKYMGVNALTKVLKRYASRVFSNLVKL
jgi:SsrA-binding protein